MTKPKSARLPFLLQRRRPDGTVAEERPYASAERAIGIATGIAATCPASTITVTDKDTGVVLYEWHGPEAVNPEDD